MMLDMFVTLLLVTLEGGDDVFTSARFKVIKAVCQNRRILHSTHSTYDCQNIKNGTVRMMLSIVECP